MSRRQNNKTATRQQPDKPTMDTNRPTPPSAERWSISRSIRQSISSFLRSSLHLLPPVFWCVAILSSIVLIAELADARPGGGQGYSGGGSGRSSGSGGGDSGALWLIIRLLIWLCIEYPAIGIPLTIAVIIAAIVMGRKKRKRDGYSEWSSGGYPNQSTPSTARSQVVSSVYINAIRKIDPKFSIVLFEDFLYSLFAEVHRARGGNNLDKLSAYLSPPATQSLRQRPVAEIHSVIVGSMKITHVSGFNPTEGHIKVGVEFEANYTQKSSPTANPQGVYAREKWTLLRSHSAKSRGPTNSNVLTCPSCGAPLNVVTAGQCGHCNQKVNNGTFDWTVQSIQLINCSNRGPILTTNTEERGTTLPTIFDPQITNTSNALSSKDPEHKWDSFFARVEMIFAEFQTAWSNRDLASMRPFLSDCLFQTQSYWIDAYKQQHLRNITERTRISGIEVVKIIMDSHYDSVTIRLRATGLDYTVTDHNRMVCGSKTVLRPYSEYWTFIRGSGTSGTSKAEKSCSNCGAPLKVNMAGFCEYCQSKVTSGQFDWVLSKIEQDESYCG